ncbi:MAG: fluoride efflux transporter CrcB [Methylococcales bacterium]|nr:fluoride efflux transporter CrcB [Methylococcales bacterium]
MGQIFAIALGGASGAVLRFLISSGVYSGLGRGFPYGTLTVNIIGSLLMGLLTAALVVEKVALSSEYRAALLVGFLGSLTTFSTFSLDTVYLITQGQLAKAGSNIAISVISCLFMVWLGLLMGKALFSYEKGLFYWHGWVFPYGLVAVNLFISLLIGVTSSLLLHKLSLSIAYQAAIIILVIGFFITFSNLYLSLQLLSEGYTFELNIKQILVILLTQTLLCCSFLTLGWFGGLLAR